MKIFKKKPSKDGPASGGGSLPAPVGGATGESKLAMRADMLENSLRQREEQLVEAHAALDEARAVFKDRSREASAAEQQREALEARLAAATAGQAAAREESATLQRRVLALQEGLGAAEAALKGKQAELDKSQKYIFEQMDRWERKSGAAAAGAGAGASAAAGAAPAAAPAAGGKGDAALEAKVRQLTKQNVDLERQLVDMTGRSIMAGDAASAKKESERLARELQEERRAGQELKVRLGQAAQEAASAMELLADATGKEQARRAELEARLETAERAVAAKEREQVLALGAQGQALAAAHARVGELEARCLRMQREGEALERQRVAALDGKTAALLLAERDKVQREEQRKRQLEVEQIMADQRQAMEALVAAVRAEERMSMQQQQQQQAKQDQQDQQLLLQQKQARPDTSGRGFSLFRRPVPTPTTPLTSPSTPPLAGAASAPAGEAFGFAPSLAPVQEKRLNLVPDMTEHTAEVARASLASMSL